MAAYTGNASAASPFASARHLGQRHAARSYAGGGAAVTTWYYRTSLGVPGSTTTFASIPVGAIRLGSSTT